MQRNKNALNFKEINIKNFKNTVSTNYAKFA